MRFAWIVLASLLVGCSSDDTSGTTDSGPQINACVAAGGRCAENAPFLCAPGYEPSTDSARATACGKSLGDDPIDVPCCFRVAPEDTGTPDTGTEDADAMSDATDASDSSEASDVSDATDDSLADAADGD